MVDGRTAAARFFHCQDIAVDCNGNIFVADRYNHRVRMISASKASTASRDERGEGAGAGLLVSTIAGEGERMAGTGGASAAVRGAVGR